MPQLFLTVAVVAVVVPVVADAPVASAGAVPVGEKERQRAPARRQSDRRAEPWSRRSRQVKLVVDAVVAAIRLFGTEVVADGNRGPGRPRIALDAERGR